MELEAEVLENDTIVFRSDEEAIKDHLAKLIFAFKDMVGDGNWLSISTYFNGEKVCVALTLNEEAHKLEEFMKGFVDENGTGS